MTLSTSQYVVSPTDTPLEFNSPTGWRAIRRGLALVMGGYFVLIGGGVLALLFVWLGIGAGPTARPVGQGMTDKEGFLLLGVLMLGLTALLSYGLVLAGQWHCLMYAPQGQHAKELMYACFHCVLLGSILSAAGACLDCGRTYDILWDGLAEVGKIDLFSPGNVLLVAGAVLGLVNMLVFSQFLRRVASCFQDRARQRVVDLNLGFVGLLLGGSFGALFYVPRIGLRGALLPWLAVGWLLCLAWHLCVVTRAYARVGDGLRASAGSPGARPAEGQPGSVSAHTLSGLHRLAKGGGR
jgi:hypothetical protein